MLLDGINHIAWISKDVARLGRFYAEYSTPTSGQRAPTAQTGKRR
jgi:hypothetical protein